MSRKNGEVVSGVVAAVSILRDRKTVTSADMCQAMGCKPETAVGYLHAMRIHGLARLASADERSGMHVHGNANVWRWKDAD